MSDQPSGFVNFMDFGENFGIPSNVGKSLSPPPPSHTSLSYNSLWYLSLFALSTFSIASVYYGVRNLRVIKRFF